jgi:hypothetical protein
MDRALAVANQVWNSPCEGKPRIIFTDIVETAGANKDHCLIGFTNQATWTWEHFCMVMIHEVGHLAGQGHSEHPASVMYDIHTLTGEWTWEVKHQGRWVKLRTKDPRCANRGKKYLRL